MAARVLLLGKKDTRDYVGAKTHYLHNAITNAGVNVVVYDMDSSDDVPPNISTSIYLSWIHLIDEGWFDFLKTVSGKRVLYTDNWHWYDECRGKFLKDDLDLESIFHSTAFATAENQRWWPRGRTDFWGVCIDEDVVTPRAEGDYIWVDEVWPEDWAKGIYTAKEVLDIVVPRIKEKYNLKVMSQKTDYPWVDELVPGDSDIQDMHNAISGAKVFLTSHQESLGLMQFEAAVAGVPVVTNSIFSQNELYQIGEGEGVFSWNWPIDKAVEEGTYASPVKDVEYGAKMMFEAFEKAIHGKRDAIRSKAIARYGKEAWINRTGLGQLAASHRRS